jgi:hypothetical protein
MDTISNSLGLSPLTPVILNEIELMVSNKDHSIVAGCFPGWKVGEMSDTHRANLSKAASLRVRTADHIEKLHEGRRKSKNSAEHMAALVSSRVGSKHTDDSKLAMSIARLNNPDRFNISRAAGKVSADKRRDDSEYKKAQSEKMKLIWAERKKVGG